MNELYQEMRNRAFKMQPNDIGITLESDSKVYTAVVDIKVRYNLITLVCTLDGRVSMYYMNGEYDVGLGANDEVRRAAISFLETSGEYIKVMKCLKAMHLATEYSQKCKDIQMFLLTKDGTYFKEIENKNTESKEGRFLNSLIQNVLTAIKNSKF